VLRNPRVLRFGFQAFFLGGSKNGILTTFAGIENALASIISSMKKREPSVLPEPAPADPLAFTASLVPGQGRTRNDTAPVRAETSALPR